MAFASVPSGSTLYAVIVRGIIHKVFYQSQRGT